ncbi:substrate-binding domain-containing protein [Streptomyces sp. SID8379]|uniref:LacI family DNA-binding transcriptional regulator n=1 Tax=unclassified Streptomyces TaxID=2593676 RepID=UPI0004778F3B|nr:LacI family DNA-binding transcriptional regulator [Streptomyces sp. HmicA12]MYW69005.1 substrate-binding domain-containing protein [Streptomyces sp. SID8379]
MSSAPTVYDVAERSGVSIATVSRVYRNPDSVRAQTRERVLASARELGYVPSGNARGLASRSTGVLGLCFPDYSDPDAESEAEAGAAAFGDEPDEDVAMLYSDQIIRGMERAARRHGYALLIAASLKGGPESQVAKVAGRVDGFAVLARTIPTEDLDVISRRQPVVMLAGPRESDDLDHLDHIEAANTDGQRELTRHLIEDHGLRRLAYIGAEESPDVQARFRGYVEACRAAGIPAADEPDLRVSMMTQAEGARATDALLDRPGERPEALLFANDQMAVGALHTLERRGVRVPRDIAVTGFDGIALSRLVRPALTTVRQPMRQMGEEAVELLVRRLTGRQDKEPVSMMLPVSVARRESCGCPSPS